MRLLRAFLPLLLFTAVIGVVFWLVMLAFVNGIGSFW